jgi:hypothetical protein
MPQQASYTTHCELSHQTDSLKAQEQQLKVPHSIAYLIQAITLLFTIGDHPLAKILCHDIINYKVEYWNGPRQPTR